MIRWWISTAHYYKQGSGVLNIWSREMQHSGRGEHCALKDLETVRKAGWQAEYWSGAGGAFSIW
jgi:hypothetical protein